MKLSKREKILIAIFILAASAAIFVKFVYSPGQTRLNELTDELNLNRKILSELKTLSKDASKNMEEIKNIDNDVRDLEKKMPGDKDLPGIVVKFYELLNSNGLAGDEIKLGDVTKGEKYDYYTISFNAVGKRENIDSFLRQLENIKTEISIVGLDLQEADDKINYKMSLVVNIFMFNYDKKSVYEPDYYFMDGSSSPYNSWYEMFKPASASAEVNNIDAAGGTNINQ